MTALVQDKVAIVTGGAKGLGHGISRCLAREGAHLLITGRDGAKTYLGRPWRVYARTVFLRTEMSDAVLPEGWHNWNKPDAEKTTFYAESGSTGPGTNDAARVKWAKSLTAAEAAALTPQKVLAGADGWDPVVQP